MLAALTVALLARLAFGIGYWVDKPLTQDEQEYLELARNLAAGAGFTYGPPPAPAGAEAPLPPQRFSRAPGYPFVLAAVIDPTRGAPTSVPTAVKVLQAFLGTLGVLLVGAVARRVAGPIAGLAAVWIAAVYPPLVWITGYAMTETLYSGLALGSVLLLDLAVPAASDRSGARAVWLGLAAGLAAGAATLVRPETLVFLVLALGWLLLRRRPTTAIVLLLGAACVIAPWTLRNVRVHGRVILVSAAGGVTFWTGNHPLAIGEGDLAANPRIKRANQTFRRSHRDATAEELESLYYEDAVAFITAHPVRWVALLARKLFYLVVPIGPSYTLHSARYLGLTWLAYGVMLPLAVLGFVRLQRRGRHPWPLWLMAASVVITCVLFMPQERFRIPVLDPTLIVCAAAWIAVTRLER